MDLKSKKWLKLLAILLICLQILDFVYTYIGITHFGVDAEGNPLIQYLVSRLGVIIGLGFPKVLGISIVIYIYRSLLEAVKLNRYILSLLVFVTLIYVIGMLEWTYVLAILGIL